MTNPLVAFLSAYGPQASSNNLYDEFVVEASSKTGCAPLLIDQPLIDMLEETVTSKEPQSIILTGTAGDGKTYSARKLFERLSNGSKAWSNTEKKVTITLAESSLELCFIKDLSELKEPEKDDIFDTVVQCLGNPSAQKKRFVICANDGHLLKFFRDRKNRDQYGFHARISTMLQKGEEKDQDRRFLLINMSRSSHEDLIHKVVHAIAHHPDWNKCDGCSAHTNLEKPCPIRINLGILQKEGADSLRGQLAEVLKISAAEGRHLPIRQLILMTVNSLLGDKKGDTGKVLLNCKTAKKRANLRHYSDSNPYDNLLGMNLPEYRRFQYSAFAVLAHLRIGDETNNQMDESIMEKTPEDGLYKYYGSAIFHDVSRRYKESPVETQIEFRTAIATQRRRVFFSFSKIPDSSVTEAVESPWIFTSFKHAAKYLEFARGISEGIPSGTIVKKILIGLNRIMSGRMTDTGNSLWLIEPSGVYRGHSIPIVIAHINNEKSNGYWINFPKNEHQNAPPRLRLNVSRLPFSIDLILKPSLFEFVIRVANGALPASLSSDSRLEISRFQLIACDAIFEKLPSLSPKEVELSGGDLQSRDISVLDQGDSWS